MPMKKILVPTDFSGNALNALLYAKELVCKFDSHLTVLHTFQVINGQICWFPLMTSSMKRRKKNGGFLEKAPSKIPVMSRSQKVMPFLYCPFYARVGRQPHCDRHQGASLKEVFMGSTTGGVIRHTHHIPVLSIPENLRPGDPKHRFCHRQYEPVRRRGGRAPPKNWPPV